MMLKRPRRNRKSPSIRLLAQETRLHPSDIIAPLFVVEGNHKKEPIDSMPGIYRFSIDFLLKEAERLHKGGIQAIALFPSIEPSLKSLEASEAHNPKGLIPKCIAALKKEFSELCIISDVALDPYTSHSHDGIVDEYQRIHNDKTVSILIKQALCHSEAGVDIVAPSDMMDGRVLKIRQQLDECNFHDVSILSYAAKYASSLYKPFRSAIQTTPAFGDKKTYQLNPANQMEALLEARLDESEGADMLLVKPATFYLDVIKLIKDHILLPVGAYHVSGEYAMVMTAHEKGILDKDQVFIEALTSIKRAGADFIFTYAYDTILKKSHEFII